MRDLKSSLEFASFCCLWMITISIGASSREQGAGNRICVVAVHDSSLFTFCPPAFRKSLADGLAKKLPPTDRRDWRPRTVI